MPYLGNEPATAFTSTTKDTFSGDGSTTDFTMSKSANVNAVRVVVENVVQNPTVAYTCNGTTLSFTSAPPTGTNNIYVIHLGPPAATVAPPTLINNPTTFTGGVTLKNETAEDTDGGRESIVTFQGTQSGNEITTLAQIEASHDGTSDDEKGDLIFRTNDGSDGSSPTEAMRITSQQRLGLGTTAPSEQLHISNADDAIVLVESTGSDATDDANIQLKTTNGTFTLQNDRSIGTSGALTIAGNTSNNIVVDHDDGKVGIGTTGGTGKLTVQDSSLPKIQANFNGAAHLEQGVGGSGCGFSMTTGHFMTFNHQPYANAGSDTNLTERMRIKSDGVLVVGDTADIRANSQTGCSVEPQGRIYMSRGTGTGGFSHLAFYNGNGLVGTIQSSGSATSYNTSSDYRLKENVTNVTDGITRVKQLAPKRFNFIADADTTVDGFLAHEAATVVPEAITGTKDEVEVWADGDKLPDGVSVGDNKLDDDGNTIPVYQGIDQSKLVPVLTAALQEAIAKIETLETKVAALEAE